MKIPFSHQRGATPARENEPHFRKNLSRQWRWHIDSRALLGATLILVSLFSAYIVSQSTSRMVTVWSAAIDLAPGEVLEESDLELTRVALTDKAQFYLDGSIPITGTHVLREIKSSELIPAFAISSTPANDLQKVPISLPALRMPSGLTSGDTVDIYGIFRSTVSTLDISSTLPSSKLLLVGVSVDAVNRDSNAMGGDTGLTILVPSVDVGRFVASIQNYDFILVKDQ